MRFMIKKTKPAAYTFDPERDGVSQSILHSWLSCREKARMGTLLGMQSPGAAWPLVYGTVMHGVLEQYYGGLTLAKKLAPFSQMANEALFQFCKSDEGKDSLERQDMAREASCLATVIMPHYHQKWKHHDERVRWTAVEKKFERPVPAARCVAVGKIDGGFQDDKKAHWLFETKNKSSFNASYDKWLGIDLQLGYYLLGYSHITQCTPVGAVYNLIRRPDRLKSKSTSFNDYLARTDEDIKKRPDHYFTRYRVKFTKEEILRHERSIEGKLIEFRRWYDSVKKDQMDPMYNPGACEQFGSTCYLIDSCAHGDRSNLVQRKAVHPELI
jgi:hypothetical protein